MQHEQNSTQTPRVVWGGVAGGAASVAAATSAPYFSLVSVNSTCRRTRGSYLRAREGGRRPALGGCSASQPHRPRPHPARSLDKLQLLGQLARVLARHVKVASPRCGEQLDEQGGRLLGRHPRLLLLVPPLLLLLLLVVVVQQRQQRLCSVKKERETLWPVVLAPHFAAICTRCCTRTLCCC